MVKNHLKRLRMPRTWQIPKKTHTWVTKPSPGPHKTRDSMPLNLIVRDILNYARTTKEVKNILNRKEITINKKVRRDHRFPVGLFDIVDIPRNNENYIVILNKKGKISLQKIEEKDSHAKYMKITGRKMLKKNKLQVNMHDSSNFLMDKNDYHVNDTLKIDLKTGKVIKALKFEKDSYAFITSGKYSGSHGVISEIQNNHAEVRIKEETIKVPKKYIFIIEKDFIKNE